MASSRPTKRSKKDAKSALEEAIEECDKLLKTSKKQRKKTRYRISRNPLTGKRNTKHPYKPRFRNQPPSTSGSGHEPDGKRMPCFLEDFWFFFLIKINDSL